MNSILQSQEETRHLSRISVYRRKAKRIVFLSRAVLRNVSRRCSRSLISHTDATLTRRRSGCRPVRRQIDEKPRCALSDELRVARVRIHVTLRRLSGKPRLYVCCAFAVDRCEEFHCRGEEYCIDTSKVLCNPLPRYCISKSLRCNGVVNCGASDSSDEEGCKSHSRRRITRAHAHEHTHAVARAHAAVCPVHVQDPQVPVSA